ncbi:MAG TPA: hypothetical protein QF641_03485 [Candidatus Thalassarchaeaceae archaeon]|jgi:hypothetical protein|nr:hypothetical protein [Candidatus Thalassarchaeaceae archaeon]|tara:strand:+ start:13049 stop:13420 length:372 start_codon:yes stop_codon:yes gene_type:complete
MDWQNTLLPGALTGGFSGVLVALLIVVGLDPGSFAGLFAIFLVMATLSAVIANQLLQKTELPHQDLKKLATIAFLTTIFPLFGASFGAPNTAPMTLLTLVLLGVIGGLVWSIPFAGWSYFKSS